MYIRLTAFLICLLALPFSSAVTFYVNDDGTVEDPNAPGPMQSTVIETDTLATLQNLRVRREQRMQYEENDFQSARERQDELIEDYLVDRYQRGRSALWDWRHPIRSAYDWRDGYQYSRQDYGWPGYTWTGTDYYAANRFYSYRGYRDPYHYSSYRYYDPYRYPYNDRYYDDDYFRPYDWYYYKDDQFFECNGDDFKQFDCSYRWDGSHFSYAIDYPDYLYYNQLYDFDDVSVSDRFVLTGGRYALCPRNAFDHDECVFYWKGGAFYFDDPSDNSFTRPNMEFDTDFDPVAFAAAQRNPPVTTQQPLQSSPSSTSPSQYYGQFSQFNFENGQFVACTGSCQYYEAADGRMYSILRR